MISGSSEQQSLFEGTKSKAENLPPMLLQYLEYKRTYPDMLLFFQVGDFFELFFDDAVTVAKTLNLTLTSRDKNSDNPVPMCGVPVGAVDGYLERLVEGGFSVAVVSQGAVQPGTKGMVPRQLERIITPGIGILGNPSAKKRHSFVAAVGGDPARGFAIAFTDVQSGEISLRDGVGVDELVGELGRIGVSEIVLPQIVSGNKLDRRSPWVRAIDSVVPSGVVKFRSVSVGETNSKGRDLGSINGYSTLSLGGKNAVRLLLDFVDEVTVKTTVPISKVSLWRDESTLQIDAPTRRNLEIVSNSRDEGISGTLFEYLNEAVSAGGERMLYGWLMRPSTDLSVIDSRHEIVARLIDYHTTRDDLRSAMRGAVDFERIATRLDLGVATPKELGSLRDSLREVPRVERLLETLELPENSVLICIKEQLSFPQEVYTDLEATLVESPPWSIHEGGIIREGVDPDLDRLRSAKSEGSSWINDLESKEREKSGISSLKIKYNSVLGFFFEITKANAHKVPEHFIRRQATANGERFTTSELQKLEREVLGAEGQILVKERALFDKLRESLRKYTAQLKSLGRGLAALDVLQGFATLAERDELKRPVVDSSRSLVISKGRHPVLSKLLRDRFVPNSLELNERSEMCAVITGPNMGGKSTYLRQAALIVVMAQIGSYVPAEASRIGIVDKVFARIGASDNLREGESTFMVEMREASNIVAHATDRSLVLIDEIGRGTATTDGLAIARAVLEWLVVRSSSRTLFATHFHELTALSDLYKQISNLSVGSVERDGDVIFTHEIGVGAAKRSYGIEVAKLAGLPDRLISRSREILHEIESREVNNQEIVDNSQLSLFTEKDAPPPCPTDYPAMRSIIEELTKVDVNQITPLEALVRLSAFVREAGKI